MSARNYSQTLGVGEQIRLPAGRFFFIRTAAAALDLTTQGNPGSPVTFLGVGAGTKFGPVEEGQGWRQLLVQSATAQNIEIIISDDGLFDVANTVTVSGSVQVQETPSTALASPAAVAVGTGTASSIAANLSRKRITISALSTNTGSLFVQATAAGAGRGIELQGGMSIELRTTAAIDLRNDSGVSCTYSTIEET